MEEEDTHTEWADEEEEVADEQFIHIRLSINPLIPNNCLNGVLCIEIFIVLRRLGTL